ncbi:MAG: efflux RND transporter periplasmic adaptor subunit [Pseudomonadales bacterium]|nr:efflux RND transporter periplasmic adaptor subunit [Pseudomonadales bacterium]
MQTVINMLNVKCLLETWPVFRYFLALCLGLGSLLAAVSIQAQGISEHGEPTTVVVKKIHSDYRSIPIDVSGRIYNKTEIKLAFKTGGLVQAVLVDEGEFVNEGQLLARLDLEEVDAAVAQAKAAYQKSLRDIERIAKLNKTNVLSRQKLQDAETEVTLRKADLKVAEFNQKYSEIRAPVSGYILHQDVEVDELVQPGKTVFVLGSNEDGWVVRAGLIDRDIVRIALDDRVEIFLDAYPGHSFNGKITQISQVVDARSGIFSVEISLNPSKLTLFSGMVASAVINPKKLQYLFYVPIESLVNSSTDEAEVYLFDRTSGRVERVSIGIAFLYRDEVAVLSGLEGHHEVVLSGVKRLQSGDVVRAVDHQGFPIPSPGTGAVGNP